MVDGIGSGHSRRITTHYKLEDQVDALEKMFMDAIEERKAGKDLHTIKPRRHDKTLLRRAMRRKAKQEKQANK